MEAVISDIPDPNPLDDWEQWEVFQQNNPHIFPTAESLRWFMRQHGTRLLQDGVMLKLAGRYFLNRKLAPTVILQIGKQATERRWQQLELPLDNPQEDTAG